MKMNRKQINSCCLNTLKEFYKELEELSYYELKKISKLEYKYRLNDDYPKMYPKELYQDENVPIK